jgi:hypothetical protein
MSQTADEKTGAAVQERSLIHAKGSVGNRLKWPGTTLDTEVGRGAFLVEMQGQKS